VTIYPPKEGYSKEQMENGHWVLDVDVKCTNPDCGKEYSAANVGGIGGKCKRCGWRCS
jgi:rubredoxin